MGKRKKKKKKQREEGRREARSLLWQIPPPESQLPQRLPLPYPWMALLPCQIQLLSKQDRPQEGRLARPPSLREQPAPCPVRGQPPTSQPQALAQTEMSAPLRQPWRLMRQLPQTMFSAPRLRRHQDLEASATPWQQLRCAPRPARFPCQGLHLRPRPRPRPRQRSRPCSRPRPSLRQLELLRQHRLSCAPALPEQVRPRHTSAEPPRATAAPRAPRSEAAPPPHCAAARRPAEARKGGSV
jgi:hypothetical protein